jgi:hypothetical protein
MEDMNAPLRYRGISPTFAVVVLVFLAFAGGLCLAFFPFDSPPRSTALMLPADGGSYQPRFAPLPKFEPGNKSGRSSDLKLGVSDPATAHPANANRLALSSDSEPDFSAVSLNAPHEPMFEGIGDVQFAASDIKAESLPVQLSSGAAAESGYDALQTTPVPEPTSILLLSLGAVMLLARRFQRDTSAH